MGGTILNREMEITEVDSCFKVIYPGATTPINEYQKVIPVNQKTVRIEKIEGCNRCCVGIWYNIVIEKSE
jgi:hypothetical protein